VVRAAAAPRGRMTRAVVLGTGSGTAVRDRAETFSQLIPRMASGGGGGNCCLQLPHRKRRNWRRDLEDSPAATAPALGCAKALAATAGRVFVIVGTLGRPMGPRHRRRHPATRCNRRGSASRRRSSSYLIGVGGGGCFRRGAPSLPFPTAAAKGGDGGEISDRRDGFVARLLPLRHWSTSR
jgi:hypothetical protein